MKFRNKEKKEAQEENVQKNEKDIEIVFGDDSNLDISDVGDCMNDLRPKDLEKNKKGIVIPKAKNKK